MTEQQAIEALHALPRLPAAAHPWSACRHCWTTLETRKRQFKCIHIAGTNGKGTLAAMTSSILTQCGLQNGSYHQSVCSQFSGAFSDQWTDDVPAHPWPV